MPSSITFSLHFSGSEVFEQSRIARTQLASLGADEHAARARLLTILAAANVFTDPPAASRAASEAGIEAEHAGDEISTAWSLIAASVSDLSCSTTERRIEMTREVLRIAQRTGETEFLTAAYLLYLAALAELGHMTELDRALSAVGPVLGAFPQLADGRHVTWFRCLQAMLSGDANAAELLAQQGLARAEPCDPDALTVHLGQLAIIRWMQGRVVELEPLFLQARQAAPHEPIWAVSLAWMWLRQGRTSAARTLVASLPPVSDLPIDRNWLSTTCILADIASQLREPNLARELYDALMPYQDRLVTIGLGIACWGTVARPLALAALAFGDSELAIVHYRRGIEVTARCGAHPWLAEMQWELSKLLGKTDAHAREETIALATESLATAQALRLHAIEEQAARALSAASNTGPWHHLEAIAPAQTQPKIQVFGGFSVVSADGLQAHWQSRKARKLLKILIARRGAAISRETLMDKLWPDMPPERLTNRFSVAIAAVRRALDPSGTFPRDAFLEYRDGLVRLRIDAVEIDAELFLAAAGQAQSAMGATAKKVGQLSAALALYTGEPLQEEQGELWSIDYCRENHRAFFSVAHTLAKYYAEEGNHLSCLETYRRVLDLDAFDQRAHEGAIRALTALGAHGQADIARGEYVRSMASLGVRID